MIALIRENGNEYYTHIYAEYGSGKKLMVLIENQDKTKLKWIKYFGKGNTRQVYMLDKSPDSWLKKGKLSGEIWVTDDKSLRPRVFSQKEYDILPSYHLCSDGYILKELNEVNTPYDANVLENIAMGFHDSIVERVKVNENAVTLYINTPWSLSMKLIFEGIERYSSFDDLSIIREAEVNVRNGKTDFFVTEGLANDFSTPVCDADYFIISDKLSYKLYFR